MPAKLRKKARGFVRDYVLTENGTQAALKNYDIKGENPEHIAAVIASENLTKPEIIEAIEEKRKAIGEYLTDELLVAVHLEGLNATKLSGTGGMKIGMKANGEIDEIGHSDLEVPDYPTRHKYLDSAYKIKGAYAPEKSVNLNIEVESDDIVEELANRLNAIHKGTDQPSDGVEASSMGEEAQNQE